MDFVLLCKTGFLPFLHGSESAHNLELVPDGTAGQRRQAVEHLAGEGTVGVDRIAAADFAVAVVVGHKDEGALGIDLADRVAQGQIVVFEGNGVEILLVGIVDADAEDDEVGSQQPQIVGEGALQVVGDGGAVHADGMV